MHGASGRGPERARRASLALDERPADMGELRRRLDRARLCTAIERRRGRVYQRIYDPALKRRDYVHRVVWRRCYGPISQGWTVDHLCREMLYQPPDHLELVIKAENTRRRHHRRSG